MKRIYLLLLIVCFFCLFLFYCIDNKHRKNQKKNEFVVVATTSIIADVVRNIVGDIATVHALMGPGVDPHLYRARENDVHKLAAANIVFYNGLHLEGKMAQVLEGMNRFTKTVSVAGAINKNQLRKADFDEMYDPHIWFDVSLWIDVVRCIQNNMIECDSEHAALYKTNGDEYVQKLERLHQYVHRHVSVIAPEKRILITAHDAFGYFGRAYGFEVVGLQGLSTDSDISTKEIKQLADYIVAKKIKAIFVESSIPQRTLIAVQNAVESRGWHVSIGDELYSDALGDEMTQASDYCGMITHNVDVIVNSLVG